LRTRSRTRWAASAARRSCWIAELDRADLREYTQVIIKEADRLQSLMDRLLRPHRLPQLAPAQHPRGARARAQRDHRRVPEAASRSPSRLRPSLPLLVGDREQMIQAVLNIVRNAAQAMKGGHGRRSPCARASLRQVTLARKRHKQALRCISDRQRPRHTGGNARTHFLSAGVRARGRQRTGLTLAQTFVNQHGGTVIEFDSQPRSHTASR
jgi:two-component system, NtrC family, nitrogen regulation sensor histidine kinase GlnL